MEDLERAIGCKVPHVERLASHDQENISAKVRQPSARWCDTGNRKRVGVSYDDASLNGPPLFFDPPCVHVPGTRESSLGQTREINAKSSE